MTASALLPRHSRWAIAGRSEPKLAALRNSLGLAAGSTHVAEYDHSLLARIFGGEAPLVGPCIVPLTAGDDTLAWVALERSPADPVGDPPPEGGKHQLGHRVDRDEGADLRAGG